MNEGRRGGRAEAGAEAAPPGSLTDCSMVEIIPRAREPTSEAGGVKPSPFIPTNSLSLSLFDGLGIQTVQVLLSGLVHSFVSYS